MRDGDRMGISAVRNSAEAQTENRGVSESDYSYEGVFFVVVVLVVWFFWAIYHRCDKIRGDKIKN